MSKNTVEAQAMGLACRLALNEEESLLSLLHRVSSIDSSKDFSEGEQDVCIRSLLVEYFGQYTVSQDNYGEEYEMPIIELCDKVQAVEDNEQFTQLEQTDCIRKLLKEFLQRRPDWKYAQSKVETYVNESLEKEFSLLKK